MLLEANPLPELDVHPLLVVSVLPCDPKCDATALLVPSAPCMCLLRPCLFLLCHGLVQPFKKETQSDTVLCKLQLKIPLSDLQDASFSNPEALPSMCTIANVDARVIYQNSHSYLSSGEAIS